MREGPLYSLWWLLKQRIIYEEHSAVRPPSLNASQKHLGGVSSPV